MSDENTPNPGETTDTNEGEERSNENLQAEFSRKFKNLSEQTESQRAETAAMNEKMDAIIQALAQQQAPKKQEMSAQDLEDLKYTDPDKYVSIQTSKIKDEVMSEVNSAQAQANERQAMLTDMVSKYPELNDPKSAVYQAALKNYQGLSDAQKQDPSSYKLAILDAVAETGVMPVSKRKKDEDLDEFIGGRSDSSSPNRDNRSAGGEKLDPRTVEVASRMGLDTSDKKVMEKLKKHAKRKWNKYQ